jgi:hypothetical protein
MVAVTQRSFATTTINDRKRAQDSAPVRLDDLHRLESRASCSNDILHNNRRFSWLDAETAPQPERTILALRKNCATTERATHFLSDDDASNGRRDHESRILRGKVTRQSSAAAFGMLRPLQDLGALQVLIAV